MPAIGIVAVRTSKRASGDEQHEPKAWTITAGCRLVGMHIAGCSIGLILKVTVFQGAGQDPSAKIMPAARFQVFELSHRRRGLRPGRGRCG